MNEAVGVFGVTKTVQKISGYKNLKYIITLKQVTKMGYKIKNAILA